MTSRLDKLLSWDDFVQFQPHWSILRMRNVLDKSCKNQNTHFVFNNFFFRKSWHLWDNVKKKNGRARYTTDGNILRCFPFARWITKATDTHSENVSILLTRRRLNMTLHVSCLSCQRLSLRVYKNISAPPHERFFGPSALLHSSRCFHKTMLLLKLLSLLSA